MPFFKDQWDSENYPSSEDYSEAKHNGTVAKDRHIIDAKSSSQPKERRFDDRTSTQAKNEKLLSEKNNPKKLKAIFFTILIIVGIILKLSGFISDIASNVNIEETSSAIEPPKVTKPESVLSKLSVSHIEVANLADYFKIKNDGSDFSLADPATVYSMNEFETNLLLSVSDKNQPRLTLVSNNESVDFFDISEFKNTNEGDFIFKPDGSLMRGVEIELVLTDLTNDAVKDAIVYYTTESNSNYIEVFYNGGTGMSSIRSYGWYEVFRDIVITDTGIIQRVDQDGNLYDEIVVEVDSAQ
jgi:hypothetical protein